MADTYTVEVHLDTGDTLTFERVPGAFARNVDPGKGGTMRFQPAPGAAFVLIPTARVAFVRALPEED